MFTIYLMKEDMKKDILGCIKVSIKEVTCLKLPRCFMESQIQNLIVVEVWPHNAVIFKDSPGKRLTCHDNSESYKDAINSLMNLKIKDALEETNITTNKEKSKISELCIEKLVKVVCAQQFTCHSNISKIDKVFI